MQRDMKDEFIPYELSLELKAIGFDEPCFGYRDGVGHLMIKSMPHCAISAPTFSQSFRFFREKYNLHSEILLDQTTQPKYCFEIHKYEDFGNYEEIRIGEWFLYRTYEEAELECLIKLIEIIKQNKL